MLLLEHKIALSAAEHVTLQCLVMITQSILVREMGIANRALVRSSNQLIFLMHLVGVCLEIFRRYESLTTSAATERKESQLHVVISIQGQFIKGGIIVLQIDQTVVGSTAACWRWLLLRLIYVYNESTLAPLPEQFVRFQAQLAEAVSCL